MYFYDQIYEWSISLYMELLVHALIEIYYADGQSRYAWWDSGLCEVLKASSEGRAINPFLYLVS